jgi:hypothetical protein
MEFGSLIKFTLDDPSAMIIQDDQCKPAFTKRLKRFTITDGNYEKKEVTGHNPQNMRQKNIKSPQ